MLPCCQMAPYIGNAILVHCLNPINLASLFREINKPKYNFGTFRPTYIQHNLKESPR